MSWRLARSDLRVSGRNGALSVAANLSGEADATGVIRLLRKVDFSSRGEVLANVSLTASPTLETDWRISPNLSEVKIDVQKTSIPIRRIVDIDAREHILPGVKATAEGLRAQLNRSVARSGLFRQAAKEGWERLCASTPLGENSGLWLETKPVVARAAQIRIDREEIRSTIGIEVKTRVLSERTRPRCPFPETLLIEKPKPGGFEIVMPALIDYETLGRTLAGEVVGKSFGKKRLRFDKGNQDPSAWRRSSA